MLCLLNHYGSLINHTIKSYLPCRHPVVAISQQPSVNMAEQVAAIPVWPRYIWSGIVVVPVPVVGDASSSSRVSALLCKDKTNETCVTGLSLTISHEPILSVFVRKCSRFHSLFCKHIRNVNSSTCVWLVLKWLNWHLNGASRNNCQTTFELSLLKCISFW